MSCEAHGLDYYTHNNADSGRRVGGWSSALERDHLRVHAGRAARR